MQADFKKTKIVATIGPSSEDEETLREIAKAGGNVIRLNFSHGDFAEHQKKVDAWRTIAKDREESLGVMQDLPGPEIRTGELEPGEVRLEEGQSFVLTTEEIPGTKDRVSVNYPHLADDLTAGDTVRLDDGKVTLVVQEIRGSEVECEVTVGGSITGRRGVNLPTADLQVSALTQADREDLAFGIENDVDFVAMSFVRTAEDVRELQRLLVEKELDAGVIAKVETQQAVDNMDAIIAAADGVMVARGDLAVEIGPENVPTVQKQLIRKCNAAGKPVITATQMLESMTDHPMPTRAEVSDVANAIFDGSDAVMLSGETTVGDHPVRSVEVMAQVARRVEAEFSERIVQEERATERSAVDTVDSITRSAVQTAHEVDAAAIVALTVSGFTARMLSRYKPKPLILGLSPNQKTVNQLSLTFGCLPLKTPHFDSFGLAMQVVRSVCAEKNLVDPGERVVVAAGLPFEENREGADTNTVFVEQV